MLDWRHKNVTAPSLDMWMLATGLGTYCRLIVQTFTASREGKEQPVQVLSSGVFPSSVSADCLTQVILNLLGFFSFRVLYLSVVAFSLFESLYFHWFCSSNPVATFSNVLILSYFIFFTFLHEETIWLLSWCLLFICVRSLFVLNIFFWLYFFCVLEKC